MINRLIESYKPLIAIPVIITIIMVAVIAFNGIEQGIDLKGGTIAVLNLEKPINQSQLQETIQKGIKSQDVTILSTKGNQVTVQMGANANVVELSDSLNGKATVQAFRSIGPVVSQQALGQVYWALAFAFIFMSITVFIIFRNFVPSIAVILAALSDIIIALGGMSLFGIPLSIASVGGLLMLIGYSVDTDILLTTRVLKRREGSLTERAVDAMKTGITMALAAIGAMLALYLVVVFFIPSAEILANIAAVLIIGLTADILATWLMNLGILRWYMEARR
jgi:preprotein translocase subunit SecF